MSTTFATAITFTGVSGVAGIAAGDLNGDGKSDIVVAGISQAANVPVVGVYLNNGTGGFGTPTVLPFNGASGGIGIGTFDGGSTADVAVVDSADNQLDVFLGDGHGNFTPGAGGALGGSGGDTALAVADFNDDGKDDAAVLDPADNQVVIEFSNGDGSFSEHATVWVPDPVALLTADFNGDTHPDLAVASGNGQVYVAINDGAGNFAGPTPFSFSSSITSLTSIATADFNNDGFPDLVGLSSGGPSGPMAGVLLNNGTGTFTASTAFPTQTNATLLTTGAFARTANQDIAAIGSDGSLDIYDGDGTGQFTPDAGNASQGNLGMPIHQAISADFNGDSVSDIAYLSGATGGGFGAVLNTTGNSSNSSALTPTIANSTLPASVVGGTTAHGFAAVSVTNTSAAAIKGIITVGVYASTDGSVDSASVLIGSLKRSGFKPSTIVTERIPIKLPATLPFGNYSLLAKVTDASGGTSVSSAGSGFAIAVPFISFSETFIKTTLTASAISGRKSHASVQLIITNNGNITSTGKSTIAIFASPDLTANDGTLIRSLPEPIVLKPGVSRTVTVPLLSLPAVANANYYLDTLVTDPNADVTSVSSGGTFPLTAPFISLVPIQQTTIIANAGKGAATVNFVLANEGNILSSGLSTINLYASTDGTLANATLVFTKQLPWSIQPQKQRIFHLHVPPAQSTTLQAASTVLMQIIDPRGGVQTVALPF